MHDEECTREHGTQLRAPLLLHTVHIMLQTAFVILILFLLLFYTGRIAAYSCVHSDTICSCDVSIDKFLDIS